MGEENGLGRVATSVFYTDAMTLRLSKSAALVDGLVRQMAPEHVVGGLSPKKARGR